MTEPGPDEWQRQLEAERQAHRRTERLLEEKTVELAQLREAAVRTEELLQRERLRERKARKQAESLLEQKSLELYYRNQDLQREVNVRLHAQEKLQQQAAALERSNEELEQFAYAASHDLQAPLRSITGFSRLLAKHAQDQLDQRSAEYLDFIDGSAKHLHCLIHALLEYARVGRAAHNPEWGSAQKIVDQACRQLEGLLNDAGATVAYEGLPEVYADATQLVQLFQNLIGNGIKYARKGVPPVVHIRARQQNGGWQFAVQDNGIGIAAGAGSQIFTIFKRLHSQQEYEGTGIGLSICKKIVERHGGRIWVESTEGQGSSFFFTLASAPDRPALLPA